jgi:two-component system CheB/CheR fusion protein
MIERNVGQAIDILEELRTRTREDPVSLAPVEISELLGKATEDIILPDDMELQVEIDERLSGILLDEAKTLRALDNLLRNAIDAMPNGGTIKLGATRDTDQFVIRVSDTGTGVPDETRRNLFKPFYTTKPGGMGLGLASTKRLVEKQGGTISFETREGEGSTFSITLPLKEKNPQ